MKGSFITGLVIFFIAAIGQDIWRASVISSQIKLSAPAEADAAAAPVVSASVGNFLEASRDHTVQIAFCTSCGYANKFTEVRTAITQELPGVTVVGSAYPVPLTSWLLSWAFYLAAPACYFLHEHFFNAMKMPMPEIVLQIKGMGFKAAMFGFYAGSMLSSRFANTGAFEVAFDGALLYSRLATGTFPAPAEIVYQLQEVLASAGQA